MKKSEVIKELHHVEAAISTWTSADGGLTAAAGDLLWGIARARKDIDSLPAPHEGLSVEYWESSCLATTGAEADVSHLMARYYSGSEEGEKDNSNDWPHNQPPVADTSHHYESEDWK